MTRMLATLHRRWWRFARDQRALAMVEFALIAPVFFVLIFGIMDFAWQIYGKSVLQGAVAKAAREATLESGAAATAAIDAKVKTAVTTVYKNAKVTFDRKSYEGFSQVGQPERYTDGNANNKRDSGECFDDANNNGIWDSDAARSGNGATDDVVLYTVTMEFDRILPMWKLLNIFYDGQQMQIATISATTVMRNQPYGMATDSTVEVCT